MQVSSYMGLVITAEEKLAEAFERVGKQHAVEIDVLQMCKLFASWSLDHLQNLKSMAGKYGQEKDDEAKDLAAALFETRMGALGLLRDLHALWLMTNEVEMCYIVLLQAAQGLRDKELELACKQFSGYTLRQKAWLLTKIKNAASQALIVAGS